MKNEYIYTSTVGLEITLTALEDGAPVDPTDASLREMVFLLPDGTKATKTPQAGVDERDRPCLRYLTQAGDLDQAGIYTVVGYIEDDTGKWPMKPVGFEVFKSLR